jgi:hypothetical protein
VGQDLDFNTVKVNYTPGDATPVQNFTDVGSAAACGLDPNGYWVDTATLTIHLCPETCATVTDDNDAQVDVVVDCGSIAN